MANILTNGFIFKDKEGVERLFGEVVEDSRYPKGHHLVTSAIKHSAVGFDEVKYAVVETESGTVYEVHKLLDREEFVAHITETYDEEKINWYLSYTNVI